MTADATVILMTFVKSFLLNTFPINLIDER